MNPIVVEACGGDDAPAINAALASAKSVVLGADAYKIASQITVPPNGRLSGTGRATTITKIANCDMIDLRGGAAIENFRMTGEGVNFSGRGVVVREGQHYQRMVNVHCDSRDYCVHFEAPDSGSHMKIEDCFVTRYPDSQKFAIKLPDSDSVSGGNRIIRDVRFSGGHGVDLAGSNNTMLERINAAQIRMDPGLSTLQVMNSRIGGRVEFHGRHIWCAFNNIANGIWIHGDVYDSCFLVPVANNPITRTDQPSNGNFVI